MTKIRRLAAVAVIISAGFVQFAEASKPLAPSRTRALCEKLLIYSGILKPATAAMLHAETPPHVHERNYIVHVLSPRTGRWTTFRRTDRDFFELREFALYPHQYLYPSAYRGQKVLDLGCGDGGLVMELRRAGVEAMGLDVFLNPYQLTKPYFIRAAAVQTGLEDSSIDVVFSTQGPLTYLTDEPEHQRAILKEIHRILRPGGRALISPIDPEIVMRLPRGLLVKTRPSKLWLTVGAENQNFEKANYWLELIKTD